MLIYLVFTRAFYCTVHCVFCIAGAGDDERMRGTDTCKFKCGVRNIFRCLSCIYLCICLFAYICSYILHLHDRFIELQTYCVFCIAGAGGNEKYAGDGHVNVNAGDDATKDVV